jgi:hypothetical protein
MGGLTAVFAPRQPGISIPGSVVQLLLVPMGHLCAKVLPDWGFTFRGKRHSLNPGPWTVKEQLLATIIQSAAGTGNYGGLLALRMPQFFNQVSGGSIGTLTPRDGSSSVSRSAWASQTRSLASARRASSAV